MPADAHSVYKTVVNASASLLPAVDITHQPVDPERVVVVPFDGTPYIVAHTLSLIRRGFVPHLLVPLGLFKPASLRRIQVACEFCDHVFDCHGTNMYWRTDTSYVRPTSFVAVSQQQALVLGELSEDDANGLLHQKFFILAHMCATEAARLNIKNVLWPFTCFTDVPVLAAAQFPGIHFETQDVPWPSSMSDAFDFLYYMSEEMEQPDMRANPDAHTWAAHYNIWQNVCPCALDDNHASHDMSDVLDFCCNMCSPCVSFVQKYAARYGLADECVDAHPAERPIFVEGTATVDEPDESLNWDHLLATRPGPAFEPTPVVRAGHHAQQTKRIRQ